MGAVVDRYRRGINAERLAAIYLRILGYRILARRHRTPVGEIDVIARRGRVIVFVEVKARRDTLAALESVTAHQRGRIVRAAQSYIAHYGAGGLGSDFAARFDVIAIVPPFSLRHIKGAWDANGVL